MSKYKFRLKITGLEMEYEGTREDIPVITKQLNQQFGGLISPEKALNSISQPEHNGKAITDIEHEEIPTKTRGRRKKINSITTEPAKTIGRVY